MPEAIVSRILRLPGYGVYACEADETAGTLWVWVRQTAPEPYYVCGGCGISVRDVHSWTERRGRGLPGGGGGGWAGGGGFCGGGGRRGGGGGGGARGGGEGPLKNRRGGGGGGGG